MILLPATDQIESYEDAMVRSPKISELPTHCIQISTHRRMVRIDDAIEETEQCYLTIEGSPDGLRWLSQHLSSLADGAERDGSSGNIVAPWDLKNEPIKLEGWDSLDFHCESDGDTKKLPS